MEVYEEGVRLHKGNDLDGAEKYYRSFLCSEPAHADCLHQLGALLVQKGDRQFTEALKLVKGAIQLAPGNARYRRSLGVVHEAAQQWLPAADAYERAIEKRPHDVQSHMDLARVLKAADRYARAAEVYRAVTRLQPDHPTAHFKLASVLKQLGRHSAAAEEYREHLHLDPSSAQSAFWLAALTSDSSAAACPPSLVSRMFDQYADHFDSHLLDKLHYKTPSTLMECIQEAASTSGAAAATAAAANKNNINITASRQPSWPRCIDLGCGTGLMGPLLRCHVGHLAGVDLSPGMIDKARERGCYDELAVGELAQFLTAAKQDGAASFDLLVAADVFVYIGDLLPVLQAAAGMASDRALFAFSTELLGTPTTSTGENSTSSTSGSCNHTAAGSDADPSNLAAAQVSGQSGASEVDSCPESPPSSWDKEAAAAAGAAPDYLLQLTGRYAHSGAYLKSAAAASGWQVLLLKEATIRFNTGKPIWGNLCVLQRHS